MDPIIDFIVKDEGEFVTISAQTERAKQFAIDHRLMVMPEIPGLPRDQPIYTSNRAAAAKLEAAGFTVWEC